MHLSLAVMILIRYIQTRGIEFINSILDCKPAINETILFPQNLVILLKVIINKFAMNDCAITARRFHIFKIF